MPPNFKIHPVVTKAIAHPKIVCGRLGHISRTNTPLSKPSRREIALLPSGTKQPVTLLIQHPRIRFHMTGRTSLARVSLSNQPSGVSGHHSKAMKGEGSTWALKQLGKRDKVQVEIVCVPWAKIYWTVESWREANFFSSRTEKFHQKGIHTW